VTETFSSISQVLRLETTPFETLRSLRFALIIVFLAGLSQTLGQSVVLFANQVKPRRFVASLIAGALIYSVSFLFFSASIWLVARFGFGLDQPFHLSVRAVGLAYAPYLFSFFTLAPYLGSFIGIALSLWSFAAILVALQVIFGLTLLQAVACSALSWLLLQIFQRTIGRPLQRLSRWVRRWVSGVSLESDWRKLLNRITDDSNNA
jgi:hypothetical protein